MINVEGLKHFVLSQWQYAKNIGLPKIGSGVLGMIILFYWKPKLLMVFVSFVIGAGLCRILYSPTRLAPNIFQWPLRIKKKKYKEDELTLMKKDCPVCGHENCGRHRPELNIVAIQPWHNMKIPLGIDNALEEFLNLTLKEFVYTWYRELSEDEAVVDELRTSLRFLVAVLLRRIHNVDLPELILQKVLKIAIRHLHFYLLVKKNVKNKDADIEQLTLDFYGSHLHVALYNRKSELEYLRGVADKLFPYALPRQSLKCRSLVVLLREIVSGVLLLSSMDVIADPDIINNLLIIFFDKASPDCHDPPSPQVNILSSFAHPLSKNRSYLHLEMSDILGDNEILFPFMQFMKSEASVNVLQFYLSVEEFNSKILTPEFTDIELEKLHTDLKDMYRNYCDPDAHDRIHFEEDIVVQLKEICEGPKEGIIKLQTTTPLFRAYEHAFNLLENTFLPLFHQSDDYYQMVCGNRLSTKLVKSQSKSLRLRESASANKLGTKIKGVFKSNTIDGLLLDEVNNFKLND